MQDRMGIGIVNSNFKEGFIKNKHYNDNSDGKGEARIIFSGVKYVVYIITSTCSGWWKYGLGEGAQGQGRPQRPWFTDIAEWTWIRITTCLREAEDRQKWRKIAKSSKSPNGWQGLHESLQL